MLTTNDELLSGSSECAALAQLGLRTLSKFNLESTNRSVDILKNGLRFDDAYFFRLVKSKFGNLSSKSIWL